MKLNLGSGDCPLEGYINLDAKTDDSLFPLVRHCCEIADHEPVPCPDNAYDEVRASHVLEHFPHGQTLNVLKEWVRVLKPGGWLKIAVPDFEWIVSRRRPEYGISEDLLQMYLFGGQTDENDYHKAVFTFDKLKRLLEECGLVGIQPWTSEIQDCASLPVSLNLMGQKPHTVSSKGDLPFWSEPDTEEDRIFKVEVQQAKGAIDERFLPFIESITPLNVYSQYGEDGIIQAIFDRIGTANKWCFECGAADGLFFSNTRRLIEQGWNALLVECDPAQYVKLVELYREVPSVHCWLNTLGATKFDSLDNYLQSANVPVDIDLVSIDIDSQEYYIVNSMIRYKPRVLIVEYAPDVDPMFIPELGGKGQAGLKAMRYVCESRGYTVIGRTPSNLICVRNDLAPLLMEKKPEAICQPASGGGTLTAEEFEGIKALLRTRADQPKPVSQPHMQVFASGRWQNLDGEIQCATQEELEAAQRGELQTRTIVSEGSRSARVALCLSTPRQGFLRPFERLLALAHMAGISVFSGDGVFWHHALSRSIRNAIEFDFEDGSDGFDFILTADYDTYAVIDDIKDLVSLLARSPEADCIVPAQMKRGGTGEILARGHNLNLMESLVPIETGHFGLTLFRKSFFERLALPWFSEKPDAEGHWGEGRIDADIGFWLNAKKAKLNVMLAPGIVVGHGEELITYPRIVNGKPQKVYQAVSDWLNGQGKPKGIGVLNDTASISRRA